MKRLGGGTEGSSAAEAKDRWRMIFQEGFEWENGRRNVL